MVNSFFDYACNTWYPNLYNNFKNNLQAAQNKRSSFCLKLSNRTSIKINEFEKINLLLIHNRVNQCTLYSIYKFCASNAPDYMNEVFSYAESYGIPTCCSYQKLKLRHCKTNKVYELCHILVPHCEINSISP